MDHSPDLVYYFDFEFGFKLLVFILLLELFLFKIIKSIKFIQNDLVRF